MSFIYEVNLTVHTEIAQRFSDWLKPHIKEMLSFDGFQSAQWYVRAPSDEGIDLNHSLWTIQYTLDKKSSYLHYVDTHAQKMRQEGLELFGDSFQATRRLLTSQQSFEKQ